MKKTKPNLLEERTKQLAKYFLLLSKVHDKADAEFLVSLGRLSMQELSVLNAIGDRQPCIMSEIAKQTSMSLSSITSIVDKLVRAKLVKRERSEEDRRIVKGILTSEGEKIYQIQVEYFHEMVKKILGVLTEEEQTDLLKISHKLVDTFWLPGPDSNQRPSD